MSELLRKSLLIGAVGLGLAWASGAQAARAPESQLEAPPAEAVISGITVGVPKVVETTKYGLMIQDYSLSVRVPYGDLDMRSPGGIAELDRRVSEGAEYACRQLELMHPAGSPALNACQRSAVRGAQPQVISARGGA